MVYQAVLFGYISSWIYNVYILGGERAWEQQIHILGLNLCCGSSTLYILTGLSNAQCMMPLLWDSVHA